MEDFLYKFLSVYHQLPLPLKQIAGRVYNYLPRRVRYGSFYSIYKKRISFFNKLKSKEEMLQEQRILLHNHVNNALRTIPYYNDYKVRYSIERFLDLPIIDKNIILKSKSEFTTSELKGKGLVVNTGGSSGTPLEFLIESGVSRSKEKAHFDWYWGQFGYKPNDKILMVRGLPLNGNRLYEYNAIDNILNISCYKANEDNILLILDKMNQFNPQFILAYPSSLKIISQLLGKHLEKISFSVRAIFLGSEHLWSDDREYLEQFYGSRVVNWYGHSERLVHGGNCPYSNEYHFYPFYGLMELVDDNNAIITEPGTEGRIIATGFDNRVMPFLRYDTGDRGILSANTECECGFKGVSLSKIIGRGQDVIVLSDNTKVSLTAFIFGQHLDAFKKIRELQVVQNKIGEIELKIVKSENYTEEDEDKLLKKLLFSVDGKIKISVKYVENISKTARGKNIFLVSRLKV